MRCAKPGLRAEDHPAAAEVGDANPPTAQSDCTETDSIESPAAVVETGAAASRRRDRIGWVRVLVCGVVPALALVLASSAGYLKWCDASARESQAAAAGAMRAAIDSTVALLSYQPDTVDKDLGAARDRLTGSFRDSYISLTNDVVIPGAKQKHISAVATVPAAAPIASSQSQAVVLVFVNQSIVVGDDPPTSSASTVKVTLDRVGDRWLISQFDPV
nr:hypothetical protein [Mycobacterium gordonae]